MEIFACGAIILVFSVAVSMVFGACVMMDDDIVDMDTDFL